MNIKDMRESYEKDILDVNHLEETPFAQFAKWFNEVKDSNVPEPNAMILSTVDARCRPSSRTVLLKEMEEDGFVFYTNYQSDKAKDLAVNDNVALIFLWKELQRQVRITGKAIKVPREQSESYFHERPKGSQIGAWASPQSRVIPDREILEKKVEELENEYENDDVLPLPDHWGGYKVLPETVEFWQGRPNRLHDRLRFEKQNGSWKIERLAP